MSEVSKMKTVALVTDNWKAPYYEQALSDADYEYEVFDGEDELEGCMLFSIKTEDIKTLAVLLSQITTGPDVKKLN